MRTRYVCLPCLHRHWDGLFKKYLQLQTSGAPVRTLRTRASNGRPRRHQDSPPHARKSRPKPRAASFSKDRPSPYILSDQETKTVIAIQAVKKELLARAVLPKPRQTKPFLKLLDSIPAEVPKNLDSQSRKDAIEKLRRAYGNLSIKSACRKLEGLFSKFSIPRIQSRKVTATPETFAKFHKAGILSHHDEVADDVQPGAAAGTHLSPGEAPDLGAQPETEVDADSSVDTAGADASERLDSAESREIIASQLSLKPLEVGKPTVPTLSFDLSRVLFNPGVYQLQDPRSRVYNFDPYLEKIMPVHEFNFDALNPYITSSKDDVLSDLARKQQKPYLGSSSSLSGILAHFHFLLSGWREISLHNLTKGFKEDSLTFTRLQRGPTAIFLRHKDGIYAVDADKEFDSANILMSLGKSMEKLLTTEREDFEKYRKSKLGEQCTPETEPEQFHYGLTGRFLLRSQLDAHDPRLPGTGMFDLKTRAVVAVRMMMREHEKGIGYQVKERFGTWESYEREYYDMIRSAFLKYSLQVRMGRMDGIFVSYHNVERIFGFQYIPLSEMDTALHGQANRALGDQEFLLSFKLIEDIFDQATAEFPGQSLRFHFETRPRVTSRLASGQNEVSPAFMYVFAEPMTEEAVEHIQQLRQQEIAAFERKLFNPAPEQSQERAAETSPSSAATDSTSNAADVDLLDSFEGLDIETAMLKGNAAGKVIDLGAAQPESQASAESSLRKQVNPTSEGRPVLGFKLITQSHVNGKPVVRPSDFVEGDEWNVRYSLQRLSSSETLSRYAGCKKRRMDALSHADKNVGDYYKRQLMRMSEEGAQWRRQQDELDAQRTPVVLYGS